MTGADAPALRALAAQLSQSAGRLDAIRQGIRSRLYSVHWDGPDGADFRRMWDGQHVPQLAAVAEGLRGSAERLLAEADQQEVASGAGGGTGAGGGGGQRIGPARDGFVPADADDPDEPTDPMELLYKGTAAVVGTVTALFSEPLRRYGVQVAGSVRANGTVVQDYWRWAAGHATSLNRLASAGNAVRIVDDLAPLGRALPVVGGLFSAQEQWSEDAGRYDTGERAVRAVAGAGAAMVVEAGATWGATALGASIGTMICPGLGTAVGGAVGFLVATVGTELLGDQITTAGAAIGSLAWDAGEAVVDFGGDVLEAGGELLGDIGEGAEELWEDLTPW
jgi:hypothetical protein